MRRCDHGPLIRRLAPWLVPVVLVTVTVGTVSIGSAQASTKQVSFNGIFIAVPSAWPVRHSWSENFCGVTAPMVLVGKAGPRVPSCTTFFNPMGPGTLVVLSTAGTTSPAPSSLRKVHGVTVRVYNEDQYSPPMTMPNHTVFVKFPRRDVSLYVNSSASSEATVQQTVSALLGSIHKTAAP